jgi:serine beta-lactamase-like protein LACTB
MIRADIADYLVQTKRKIRNLEIMQDLKKIRVIGACLIIGLLLFSCAREQTAEQRATDIGNQYLADSGVSGLVISVGKSGGIVWSKGFGFADVEQLVSSDPALTRYRVGSTAKSMTAMAVGQLYESGRLDLDAPIQQYVPDFPEKESVITTRMLAGHLAGIRHYKDDEFLSDVAYRSVTQALTVFADDPLQVTPGSEFLYSTYGFNLISAVVEGAAEQDFLDYMTVNVFEPTRMTRTTADKVRPIISHRSRYYTQEDGDLVNTPWVDNSNKWAGGGFLSTSEDLVRFGLAHLSDEYLEIETIKMMWTSQSTLDGEDTGYGIGWSIGSDEKARNVIRHGGGSVGGITELRIYPSEKVVVAIITNTSPADLRLLADEIAEIFLNE